MWFRRGHRNENRKNTMLEEPTCSQKVVFRLDTPGSENVRVNFVFDSVDIVVEYKYEENHSISSRYILFRSVSKFTFTRICDLKSYPEGAYDAVLACEEISEKRWRFVCFFSDHGLAEVVAESAEKLDSSPHGYAKVFSEIPDNL